MQFRLMSDTLIAENIAAWEKVLRDTPTEGNANMSVRNVATETIDALEREIVVREAYDAATREEVDAFCDVRMACERAMLDPREVMINMGMDPKRYDALTRYYDGVGRQG